MYGPGYEPPPVEKIRKAQWTPENTAKTQAIVNRLWAGSRALEMVFGHNCPAIHDMRAAIDRLMELDRNVQAPKDAR